jgi:copper transport protein
MRRCRRISIAAAAAALGSLLLPAAAWAHAALLHTSPSASGTVDTPPAQVMLTYSEPVEPRFAIVSVTDAAGRQQTAGPPRRDPANPNQLDVPLHTVPEGWYLVYWRVISVDGHPVRGAFTFAVGPNPGPAPQFVIPSVSETAATPGLLIARWLTFLSVMAAVGIFVLRAVIVRPVVSRVSETTLRAVSIAFWTALAVALVVTPIYVLMATAKFALRSVFALGSLVPLLRVSAFGRGYLDLELILALFAVAAAITLWLDDARQRVRTVATLLALGAALAAAAAALLVPGLAGHASQTAPRGLAITLDWLHVAAGAVWIGGLIGLLVLWRSLPEARRIAGLMVSVPRFSNAAFVSVLVLIGSGIGASLIHLPTLASLWQTSYGKTLMLKIGLLLAALCLAAFNLALTKPRLVAARSDLQLGVGAARLLRRLVGGEILLVAAAVFAAGLLSSLPPPAKALASAGQAAASVGPGPVARVLEKNGYRLEFRLDPNQAAVPNTFAVRISKDGKPVRHADVTTSFEMLDMEMGQQAYQLAETSPGVYEHSAPALVMVGHWGLAYEIRPQHGTPFDVLLLDKANG